MSQRLVFLCVFLLASFMAPAQAADVTGAWRVTITTPDREVTGKGSFRQTGNAVTGRVGPSEDDPIPVTGIVNGNKLVLNTHPQPGRTVAFDKCEVAIGSDRMSGTIDTDKGKIEFVRSKP